MILDLGLNDNPIIDNIEDAAFQELDILFGTDNTELIGEPSFGTNFERFIWELTPNVISLKNYIENKIEAETFFLKQLTYTVDVNIEENDEGKKYIVSIYLYKDGQIISNKIITIK